MTTFDINQLFTPKLAPEWMQKMLADAAVEGLSTTSWESGGMVRTIFAIMSNLFAEEDGMISLMAQGRFLDWAASGIVTYTSSNGQIVTQKVTPDPSVPGENPDGVPGWLDVLAISSYGETRIGSKAASGPLAIANTTTNTYGPFAVGTYHVSNPGTGTGYHNSSVLTIPPSVQVGGGIVGATTTSPIQVTTASAHGLVGSETIYVSGVNGISGANGFWSVIVTGSNSFSLVGSIGVGTYTSGGSARVATISQIEADLSGPTGTSAPGSISQAVTSLSGVSVYNLGTLAGSAYESNLELAARCRLKLAALSPDGPKDAYAYFALTSVDKLPLMTPPGFLSQRITRVKVVGNIATGIIEVIIANAAGAVPGVSNAEISNCTNTTPIEVTTTFPHTLNTGDYASISGVIGTSNANSTWTISVTGANTFTLDNSVGNGTYLGGGLLEGGDLGQVDRLIQANTVPTSNQAITKSATSFDVAIQAAVEVPSAQVAIYAAAVQTAIANYFSALDIGGIVGALQYNDIIGVLWAAGTLNSRPSYVQRITLLTLNGLSGDLPYPSSDAVAQLVPAPVINITGV